MKQFVAWCAVVLVPVVVLGGLWGLRRDPGRPNWALPTQMASSAAFLSQTANPVLPDGQTMQTPPEGTLAREAQAFHYADTDADRQRAGRELTNPFPTTPEVLDRGKYIYQTFCLVCHGPSGAGDGPIVPKFPNPPNLHSAKSKALRDGEIFHLLTRGRNKMPSYAVQVSWEDRWRVIRYVRALQEGPR